MNALQKEQKEACDAADVAVDVAVESCLMAYTDLTFAEQAVEKAAHELSCLVVIAAPPS